MPLKPTHSQYDSLPPRKSTHAKSENVRDDSLKEEDQLSELVKMFAMHYSKVEKMFKTIDVQMMQLETKLADCFGRFNAI